MSRLREVATRLGHLLGVLSAGGSARPNRVRAAHLLESIWQDVRFGARLIRRDPGTTAMLTLSLGVGLGVCTAVFSLTDALLLRPPAVAAPERLVQVWSREPEREPGPMSHATYVELRDGSSAFTSLAAFGSAARSLWHDASGTRAVQMQLVSGNFFDVLGLHAELGRTFLPDEDAAPGAHPVAVVSHDFWRQRLGASTRAVGSTLRLNGAAYTVIGVAPRRFTTIEIGSRPDCWVPLAMAADSQGLGALTERGNRWLSTVGRMRPGVSRADVRANVAVLVARLRRSFPAVDRDLDATVTPMELTGGRLRGAAIAPLTVLAVLVGMVLLIACTNAASLLLAKATMRQREQAMRSALGARRGRLVRQGLIESCLVALLAGAAGAIFASFTVPLLLALAPPSLLLRLDVPVDGRVVAFTAALSLLTGLALGWGASLRLAGAVASSAAGAVRSPGGARTSRLSSLLLAAQVAICLTLLIGAGLCVRSLRNATAIDPGFDAGRVAMADLDPALAGRSPAQADAFYRDLLRQVRVAPGVRSASLTGYLPLGMDRFKTSLVIEGVEGVTRIGGGGGIAGSRPARDGEGILVGATTVAEDYFRTLGIPLLRGRELTAREAWSADAGSPQPVVVNEVLARRIQPAGDSVGRRLSQGKRRVPLLVIGVAKTGKYETLGERPQPYVYFPIGHGARATLLVQAAGDPRSALPSIRQAVRAIDGKMAPSNLRTMGQYMELPMFPARAAGYLLSVLGAMALVLAVSGLFGSISYAVTRRRREIGIRVALGGKSWQVLGPLMGRGMRPVFSGIAAGLALSLAATRVLAAILYGISPLDAVSFLGGTLSLLAAALLAVYIPARRALDVDPNLVLRAE